MTLKHAVTATGTNDGSKQVSVTAWNQDHVIDVEGLLIPQHSGTPTTPTNGNTKVFTRSGANRALLGVIGSTGEDYTLQPSIARNRVRLIIANGPGLATFSVIGTSLTTTVGTATTRTWAATNSLTRATRAAITSVATAGSFAHTRTGTATTGATTVSTGDGGTYPLGGFFHVARFGISDNVAGARMFLGFAASSAAPTNVEPSTLVNCIGIAQLSTDSTQLYLVYGGTSAQTPIGLGSTNFPINTTTLYDLTIYSPPNVANTLYYEVTNLGTGAKASGTIPTGNAFTPTSTTGLCWHVWRTNNATASPVSVDVSSVYIETDQ